MGRGRCFRFCVTLSCIAAGLILAASAEPISTSRPSFTDASTTVPEHSLQVESGATYTDSRGRTRSWTVPETLVRYGLTENTELRVLPPVYLWNENQTRNIQTGNFGDIAVGLSHHRRLPGRIDMALIPLLNLPTGANNVSANGVDPQIRVAASRQMTERVTVGSQFDVRWNTSRNAAAEVTFTPTFITYYQFADRVQGFLEYAGVIPTSGPTTQYLQAGLLYAPTQRQQLDVRIATGLNGSSPNFLVGFGYSFRLDHLPGF